MPELQANPPCRGAELAVLVDLEARWENLRATRSSAGPSSLQELQSYQRAYDLFHTKLVAYNKRYTPRHIPEVLINTSVRLEQWCKKLSALFTTRRCVQQPAAPLQHSFAHPGRDECPGAGLARRYS